MKAYTHLFFDLDNTLWDFTGNSRLCLIQLYNEFELAKQGISTEEAFLANYQVQNNAYWADYRAGKIDQLNLRWQRFYSTLAGFGFEDRGVALKMGARYLDLLGTKTLLCEGALQCLDRLQPHYGMSIITNGFEEVQHQKLLKSGLMGYFKSVTTSEDAGSVKPDPVIFQTACKKSAADPATSLYIGDSPLVDGSSVNVGMDFVWYNPKALEAPKPLTQVASLSALSDMLIQK